MIRILFITFLINIISCKGTAIKNDRSPEELNLIQVNAPTSDSLLLGIQDKIYSAFVQCTLAKDHQLLKKLSLDLEALYTSDQRNLILYWRAYLQLYSSIYYLKIADKKSAEIEVDKGVSWLTSMKNKNSEDHALLGMLQGFSLSFDKGIKTPFIAREAKKNVKQAIAKDSTNHRAYYVYASNDFYTPSKYGGGKDAEAFLLKAISLPAQKIKNEYLPSWGKEQAYEMLIKLYIKNREWTSAKKYFQEGISLYPENYALTQLASQLIGK